MDGSSTYQHSASLDTDFRRLSQSIGSNVQKILQNVSSMDRMIKTIGTERENPQLQTQLHQVTHYTGQLAKDTSKHLKDLSSISTGSVDGIASQSEQRQWRLQRERLQDDFTTALNKFQAAQRLAAQKEKEVIKKTRNTELDQSQQQGNLIDMDDTPSNSGANQQQVNTQILIEDDYNIQQLQERENSIRQLEADIVDVNTIFKDLATMVHEQGDTVNSIEANVDHATISVHDGADQLRQAEIYKNKARKKKVCLAVFGIVVLAIIIGIIVWAAKK
jgi:t-SNARE complex subunit (syntaxin)